MPQIPGHHAPHDFATIPHRQFRAQNQRGRLDVCHRSRHSRPHQNWRHRHRSPLRRNQNHLLLHVRPAIFQQILLIHLFHHLHHSVSHHGHHLRQDVHLHLLFHQQEYHRRPGESGDPPAPKVIVEGGKSGVSDRVCLDRLFHAVLVAAVSRHLRAKFDSR